MGELPARSLLERVGDEELGWEVDEQGRYGLFEVPAGGPGAELAGRRGYVRMSVVKPASEGSSLTSASEAESIEARRTKMKTAGRHSLNKKNYYYFLFLFLFVFVFVVFFVFFNCFFVLFVFVFVVFVFLMS